MYLIDPIPVTPATGVLVSSNVAYPDGTIGFLDGDYKRWVRDRAYPVGTPVVHFGAVWVNLVEIPANPPSNETIGLPPGHPQTFLIWARQDVPVPWSAEEDHETGALVSFPAVTYAASLPESAAEDAWDALADAAHVPTFTPAGYPAGMWRRNATPDDGESLLPKYPSLASKYWEAMEPPLFEQLPEIPVGELTTFGGRIWRKRTATMAAYEAPPSAPDDWALVRTSNRYAMFDSSAQSQTRQRAGSRYNPPTPVLDETIVQVLQAPAGRIVDAVCLLNLEATSVRVQVVDSVEASIYDQTRPMVTTAMVISNWYDYFTAPRHYKSAVLFDDIPGTAGAKVTITITNSGGQAACGRCIVGKRVELGATLLGLGTGFKDYSFKSRDQYGNTTVKEGAWSKRLVLPVRVHNDLLEPLESTLIGFRATAAMYIGHPKFPTSWAYGWFTDLNVTVPYPTFATYELEVESTT